MEEAQRASGLSNEAIARRIPVSEKTWRRWKERGEIPTASLPAVATALNLELRAFQEETVGAPGGELGAPADLEDLRETVHHLSDQLAAVVPLLQRLLERDQDS